ncbi:MAG: hypothetical protein ACUVQ4_09500 [bacterium]
MSAQRKLIYFVLIISPLLLGKSEVQLKISGQECLINVLSSNNKTRIESGLNTSSVGKLSTGLKISIGYNSLLKRILRDSTHQLIIGVSLNRDINNLIDAEFTLSYQYLKSMFFGEGFTTIYYFDNLLLPIALKFEFLKKGIISLNWDMGAEAVIQFNGEWELWDNDGIFSRGKIEHLEKLFYLYTGFGSNVIVSPLIRLQIGTSLGYCVTPKIAYVISNYPLRLCLGIMFLLK